MTSPFSFASTPSLQFGNGKFSVLPDAIRSFGSNVLLVTGAKSLLSSSYFSYLSEQLESKSIVFKHCIVETEPSPSLIDAVVQQFSFERIDSVVAIGGGSVLDAGKAISAMLPLKTPVKEYLEGVGNKHAHPGVKVPFIAVPTTSGTGSEATKNAVLSETGENGYKKSLRHNNFVPDLAIVDPTLAVSCPPSVTAASGMDAFTQLLESYVSTAANPITDALAYTGLKLISNSLFRSYHEGNNLEARGEMALASYLSGITLANAGLGLVHGFASSIGGYLSIPHGVICSSLMPATNTVTVKHLRICKDERSLKKFADIGRLFSGAKDKTDDFYVDALLEKIASLAVEMDIPRLYQAGVKRTDFKKILSNTDNKNNPVILQPEQMLEILEMSGNVI